MDAKRPTNLLHVSRDVLERITRMLDGVEIMILAETCPAMYGVLFREGTVLQFQVCARVRTRFVWPVVLSSMHRLSHLSICLGRRTSIKSASQYMSQSLPASLKVLRLQFEQAEEFFALSPLELALVLTLRNKLSQSPNRGSVFDLSSAFPELHTLELDGKAMIKGEAVARLPRSLTSLTLQSQDWNAEAFANLPRGLLEFRMLQGTAVQEKSMQNLPPGLTSLAFPRHVALGSEWQWLPPSLTKYQHSGLAIVSDAPKHELMAKAQSENTIRFVAHVLELPRSLTYLTMNLSEYANTTQTIALLPPGLTYLQLKLYGALTSEAIHSLPRSITSLVVRSRDCWQEIMAEAWPPRLTELTISHKATDPAKANPLNLPRTLQSLWLGEHVVLDDAFLDALPTGLQKMSLANATSLKTPEKVVRLPRNVTSLALFNLPPSFSDLCIAHLPNGLTALLLNGPISISDACAQNLPRTLTDLTIDSSTTLLTHVGLAALPPSLLYLGLWYTAFSLSVASALPPNLVFLGLESKPSAEELREVSLPPTLITLKTRVWSLETVKQILPIIVVKPYRADLMSKQKRLTGKSKAIENGIWSY